MNLGSPNTLTRGDDSYSSAITSSESIRFAYSSERTVYVSGGESSLSGLISPLRPVTRQQRTRSGRMKGGPVVFLVLSLSVAHSASAASKYAYLFPSRGAYDLGPF